MSQESSNTKSIDNGIEAPAKIIENLPPGKHSDRIRHPGAQASCPLTPDPRPLSPDF